MRNIKPKKTKSLTTDGVNHVPPNCRISNQRASPFVFEDELRSQDNIQRPESLPLPLLLLPSPSLCASPLRVSWGLLGVLGTLPRLSAEAPRQLRGVCGERGGVRGPKGGRPNISRLFFPLPPRISFSVFLSGVFSSNCSRSSRPRTTQNAFWEFFFFFFWKDTECETLSRHRTEPGICTASHANFVSRSTSSTKGTSPPVPEVGRRSNRDVANVRAALQARMQCRKSPSQTPDRSSQFRVVGRSASGGGIQLQSGSTHRERGTESCDAPGVWGSSGGACRCVGGIAIRGE